MTALVLLAALLWVPGALLHRGFHLAPGSWGTGRLALEATLSLAFLSLLLLPLYAAQASVSLALPVTLLGVAVLAVAAAFARRRRLSLSANVAPEQQANTAAVSSPFEKLAFAIAVVLLVPVTLAHSGANVDDWWDLSFVSGWIADGHFSFGQMALSPPPALPGEGIVGETVLRETVLREAVLRETVLRETVLREVVHPRFLWSVWLMLQTMVATVSGQAAWRIQAGPLAAITMVLIVSAQAMLARALFRDSARQVALVVATVLVTVVWVWGTEATPLFVRGYQDKFVAAFVLAPVLLALVVEAARPGARSVSSLAVAAAAVATVSVHSLVFTMAAFTCVVALAALQGHALAAWVAARRALVAALVLPALYPLGQAMVLAATFGDQGISIAVRDNPVVRAHLSLNRLIADNTAAWIVDPGAVFGTIALLALLALGAAWRRRTDPAARVLFAICTAPCLLLFVPGLAALAGQLWVPWMLYRLGWMVPVPALLAFAIVEMAPHGQAPDAGGSNLPGSNGKPVIERSGRLPLVSMSLVLGMMVLVASTANDRLRRGLGQHPGQFYGAPRAAAASVFDYLDRQPGRDVVLALPNFSEFVPALSGKPVVAFPERGTLVFSPDEATAYQRMLDRALFFSAAASREERSEIAERYDVRWAILPRRFLASGSESAWLRRFGSRALLAARAADERAGPGGDGRGGDARGGEDVSASTETWWSATHAAVSEGLGESWTIALETRDYFVVERSDSSHSVYPASPSAASPSTASRPGSAGSEVAAWLLPFDLSPADPSPSHLDVLASVDSSPGSVVSYSLPPRVAAPSVLPVWVDGPLAWEDVPAEVEIRMDIGTPCRVEGVEVVPYLPHDRREVLEFEVNGRRLRAAGRHNEGIVVALKSERAERQVSLRLRSLLGNPISLADVRLLGDHTSCGEGWPVFRRTQRASPLVSADAELELAGHHPDSGRPLLALAHRAARTRAQGEALELLAESTRREPSLVEGWIELGFAQDEIAAEEEAGSEGEAKLQAQALQSFSSGVDADSHSGWAHGCLAWAEQRSGHQLSAAWHALLAAYLDPLYADAWTVMAYVLTDLRLAPLAERALLVAEKADPDRNWPSLARADFALRRGEVEAARSALRGWIRKHPYDEAARSKMSDVAAAAARLRNEEESTIDAAQESDAASGADIRAAP